MPAGDVSREPLPIQKVRHSWRASFSAPILLGSTVAVNLTLPFGGHCVPAVSRSIALILTPLVSATSPAICPGRARSFARGTALAAAVSGLVDPFQAGVSPVSSGARSTLTPRPRRRSTTVSTTTEVATFTHGTAVAHVNLQRYIERTSLSAETVS